MASKTEWNEFFLDAKIPKDVAARYAVNFYKNRMSFDMLSDLNKDYLRDLDITVLGDVISILKHAKDVQSKQDSDVFIVPEAKKVDRKVSPAPPPQVKEVPKQIEKKNETVSARLGPPKALKFPTPIPASSGGVSHHVQDSTKKSAIFSRLDKKQDSSSPLTRIRVALDDSKIARSVNTVRNNHPDDQMESSRNLLKRPAPNSGASAVRGNKDSSGGPKKKYFVWKTYSDGSKVKEYIDKDQIPDYAMSKKGKFDGDDQVDGLRNMLMRKKLPPAASTQPRIRDPDVFDRIGNNRNSSASNSSSTFSRTTLNADRNTQEQQKSVKSRLSLPNKSGSGSIRITTTNRSMSSPSRAAVPKARNRISAPSDRDDQVTRTHQTKVVDRLGPKVPKARKRITAPEDSEDHYNEDKNDTINKDKDTTYRSLNTGSLNDRIGHRGYYKRN